MSERKFNPITPPFDLVNNQANEISITDSGGYYTGAEVETALQELGDGTALDGRYVLESGDTMSGSLLVDTDLAYDLGSSAKYWNNAYLGSVYTSGASGNIFLTSDNSAVGGSKWEFKHEGVIKGILDGNEKFKFGTDGSLQVGDVPYGGGPGSNFHAKDSITDDYGVDIWAENTSTATESNAILWLTGNNGAVGFGQVADGLGTYSDGINSPALVFDLYTNHPIVFNTNAVERMRITGSGNVNINTGQINLGSNANPIVQETDNAAWGSTDKKLTLQAGNTLTLDAVKSEDYQTTIANETGIVSYWKMDGDFTDSVGTNDGTAYGGASADGTSKYGTYSGSFDGTDDYVDFGDKTDFDFGGNDFTIEFWMNGVQDGSVSAIIQKYALNEGWIVQEGSDNKIRFLAYDGTAQVDFQDPTAFPNNQWVYYVITRNGSDWTMYRDGESVATDSWSGTIANEAGNNMWVGRQNYSTRYYQGLVDEVAIYNTALSASTIQEHYTGGSARSKIDITNSEGGNVDIYTAGGYYGGLNNTELKLTPSVADGATAVAYTFDTENALSTAGALHTKWINNGTDLMALDKDGNLGIGTTTPDSKLQVVGTTKFGEDTTNFSEFESDGTLVFNGNATVWDDLRTPANNVKLDSTKPPTETAYKGGQVLAFASNSNNKIYFNVQLPHNYKLGSDIEFHVHMALPTSGAGGGAENVKFDFTHSWADLAASFPAETTVSATRDVQNDTADEHILFTIAGTIDGSSISDISSMIICSLERDVSVANDYADDVYLAEVDFHYEIDTVGSRQILAK